MNDVPNHAADFTECHRMPDQAFVSASGGLEGAEMPGEGPVSDGVSFDGAAFLRSLGDALGLPDGPYPGSEEGSGDEGSSFFGGGSSDDDEAPDLETVYHAQRAERAQQRHLGTGAGKKEDASTTAAAASKGPLQAARAAAPEDDEQWEALTATDSDDNDEGAADDADFHAAYKQSLQRELAASRMGASFARSGSSGAQEGPSAAAEGDMDEELAPVDVDLNLVRSLLASYAGAPAGGCCSCLACKHFALFGLLLLLRCMCG